MKEQIVQHPRPIEVDSLERLEAWLAGDRPGGVTTIFQGLELGPFDQRVATRSLDEVVFLGCQLGPRTLKRAGDEGALVFPRLQQTPFEPHRNRLYSPRELFDGYRAGDFESYYKTLDGSVYRHFVATGGSTPWSLYETLARRLHDHAMSDALEEFIEGKRVVAVMGGHALLRTDPGYRAVADLSRRLARRGFLMTSGGGPGAMEATHLGAIHRDLPDEDLDAAIDVLSVAPSYKDGAAWLDTSLGVLDRLEASGAELGTSLGIPTWTFGHEPPTAFATHIAKYFANSVREDGLLAIAKGGVVFSPGSAGTVQEVFQDATQNHYETLGHPSPMIFLGSDFWRQQLPVLPLLEKLSADKPYADLLYATDSVEEVVGRLCEFAGA